MSASKAFKSYWAVDYLQTPKEVAEHLNAAIEDGHPAILHKALRNVADSIGGSYHLTRETGLTRESLSRALSEEGNPRLSSPNAILRVMGLKSNIQTLSLDTACDKWKQA
ncbi:MAG TPA: putative addiction module antidote protein [Gammaproteobacteria bacterium]|nr:putative addiction module antidote protein [Gammaproteobacteria bacterium]